MSRLPGLRRAGVGVVDQGLYSLANFALTVLVARSAAPRDFGAYALVAATYVVVVAVTRGLTSETFVVRYSRAREDPDDGRGDGPEDGVAPDRWAAGAGAAAGTSLTVGAVVGIVLVAVGIALLGGPTSGVLVVFGALLPGLLLQDLYRYVALADGRPALALVNDVVTVVVQFGASALLLATGHASAVTLVAAWGGAAAVGAAVGGRLLDVRPRPGRTADWLQQHRDLALRYAADDLANQSAQLTGYVVAGVAGLAEAGALRAAQTVYGPPSIANMSVMVAVTPELVRVRRRTPARLPRLAGLLALSQCGLGAAWTVAALLAPDPVGEALFGATWRHASPLLLLLGIGQIGIGLRVGPMAGLRALGAARRTLRARAVVTTLAWAASLTAALLGGAEGVAWAGAIVNPVQAGVWWWQFRRALRDDEPAPEPDPTPAGGLPVRRPR